MVETGRQGPWHPRGQGLLVAVVALSVVALTAHGFVALRLLQGTVHRPATAGSTTGGRTTPPSPSSPGPSGSASGSPTSGGAASSLALASDCLVADNPRTAATIPAADPFGTDLADLGSGAELQRLYAVDDRSLTPVDGAGPVRDCDRQLWDIVVSATSSTQRGWLKELLVFDADPASADPGGGDLIPAGQDPSRWRLALAPNGASDADVALTVAHLLGHLIALNPGQLAAPPPATCPTFDAGLGCLDQNAYLVDFVGRTWSAAEVTDWGTATQKNDPAQRDKALDDFYAKHHTSFVDSFAATDPLEDFAESFSLWCAVGPANPDLPDYIEGDPTDGSAKLDWFDHGSTGFSRDYSSPCSPLRELTR